MLPKQTLSSKITIALLVIMLAFLGQLKFKQWQNQNRIEKEKLSLQKQADELQKKNQELTQSLEYLNSSDFKERVAREQLALKKEGEQVYSFSFRPKTESVKSQAENKQGNMEKWWTYFFKN